MFLKSILGVVIVLVLGAVLIVLASNPRVTSPRRGEDLIKLHPYNIARELLGLEETLPDIVHVTVKPKLGIIDAFVNIFCTFVIGIADFVFVVLGGVFYVFKGIFTGQWLDLIGGVVGIIVGCLAPLIIWGLLLFQNGTPAYYFIMVGLGLPLTIFGWVLGILIPAKPDLIIYVWLR